MADKSQGTRLFWSIAAYLVISGGLGWFYFLSDESHGLLLLPMLVILIGMSAYGMNVCKGTGWRAVLMVYGGLNSLALLLLMAFPFIQGGSQKTCIEMMSAIQQAVEQKIPGRDDASAVAEYCRRKSYSAPQTRRILEYFKRYRIYGPESAVHIADANWEHHCGALNEIGHDGTRRTTIKRVRNFRKISWTLRKIASMNW